MTESTLDLRIASVFIILAASMMGAMPPLFIKAFRDPNSVMTFLLRALSAGVILALALVHVMAEGISQLSQINEYPIGGCCVLFGILVMAITENLAHIYVAKNNAELFDEAGSSEAALESKELELKETEEKELEQKGSVSNSLPVKHIATESEASECSDAVDGMNNDHACVSSIVAVSMLKQTQTGTTRQRITAYMFEIGCVVHSVLIGLNLGVMVDDRSAVIAMIIALVFHQGIEGLGLGSVLVLGKIEMKSAITMVVSYSITTPLGTAIGIGISNAYDPESNVALVVQGVLNCVSAGLLLYISMVQMIAEDFTRPDLTKSMTFHVWSYVALFFGCASMAGIGYWA